LGLPIGNLTSQFFGNVYLNALDQFVKHELKACHYIRYVDDAVLLHDDRSVLEGWKNTIEGFIGERLGLQLNKSATRLNPVSCGINFLGYIVHPTHRLTRRRVVCNLEVRLAEYRDILVDHNAETNVTTFRFDPDILERLLATVNSYLAHMVKASSHNLLTGILAEHPWLSRYFRIDDYKATRLWKPLRDFPGLAGQYAWFRRTWPDAMIFFQVGRYVELYGDDTIWAKDCLGLHPLKPRFRKQPRVGIPERLSERYMQAASRAGRTVLKVSETGYLLWRLKERLPVELFVPVEGANARMCSAGYEMKTGVC